MNLIVAVDKNFGIGKNGDMPWHIPADLQYFKQKTLGKTVVMGRKTLESLPGAKPLKGRNNIVISTNKSFICEGATVCYSIDEALTAMQNLPCDDVMIIGGASIYNELYPYCKRAYITKIDAEFDVDTGIVNFDNEPGWSIESVSEIQKNHDIEFCYMVYVNNSVASISKDLPLK